MRTRFGIVVCALAFCASLGSTVRGSQASRAASTHGAYKIYLILHQVGEEQYDIATGVDGTRTLTTTFDYTDRTSKRTTTAKLGTTLDDRPLSLEVSGASMLSAKVDGNTLSVTM